MIIAKEAEEQIVNFGVFEYDTLKMSNILDVPEHEIIKEMEKEQIIDSYTTGLIDPLIMKNYKRLSVDEIRIELKKQASEYYNEIFEKEIK